MKEMAKGWYGSAKSMAEMAEQAISERGGHCLNCTCKSLLTAKRPPVGSGVVRSQNLSVQVKCDVDPFRRYPFRGEEVQSSECPSLKRHMRMQQKV
jgi:hypothetical protein